MEPIPAVDTMTESDWRIKRDLVDGVKTIRVFRGPEGANGELDAANSEGYWFSESGQLIKACVSGLEVLPKDVQAYGSVQVARRIDVMKDGKLVIRVNVNEVDMADPAKADSFVLKGKEWDRKFTAEIR
jgi:hypothetical protein